MVDLTKKKTLAEYDTDALASGDTVVAYRSTNAVGEKVFRGDIVAGTAASIAEGTSEALKMYSDKELKESLSTGAIPIGTDTEIETGTDTVAKIYAPDQLNSAIKTIAQSQEVSLAGLSATVPLFEGHSVFLSLGGRSGDFIWTLGDFSAEVAVDTLQGVYVESDTVAATVGCWVRKLDGYVTPEMFGLVDDPTGAFDQFNEMQACSDFARDNNYQIECSSSFYNDSDVNGSVLFYNSITFRSGAGVIYKDQTTTVIKFTNAMQAIELTPADLSGFDEYSMQITGLPTHAAGDFLVIDSAEILIERLNSPAFPFYRKREMTVMADDDGRLAIPIMETYDMGLIVDGGYAGSIKLYRREPVIKIQNFKMATYNGAAVDCNVDGLVIAEHRYVVHEDTEFTGIRNDYSNWKNYECAATNVRPVMDGDWDNSIGYGIYNFATVLSVTTDGQMTRFRHAIAGRHDKNTTVRGGYYDKDIDTHYGYFMKLRDLQMNGTYSFAGCDFSAKGITQYLTETTGMFTERTDTPETRGTITLEDIDLYANIEVVNGNIFAAVFGAQSAYTFARDLIKPDVVNINHIRIHNVSGYNTIKLLAHFRPDDYNYESFGEINISNISQIETDSVIEAIAFMTKGDTQAWTRNTTINLSNMGRISTRIQNNETTFDDSYGYIINANGVRELSLRADMSAIAGGKITTSAIKTLSNDTTSDFSITDTIGNLYIDNSCDFIYTSRQALWPILRGTYSHYIERDTADAIPLEFKEDGTIELVCKDDPWGSGKVLIDENQNHASVCWNNLFSGTSGVKAIDNTVLAGTTGDDDDITLSCKNFYLYIENRRGGAETSRNFLVKLDTF